jgi:hypothetical protein
MARASAAAPNPPNPKQTALNSDWNLNEDAKKIRASQQSLPNLQPAIQLAQEMGGRVGRG